MTPEVKETFTEKLRQIPKEWCRPDPGEVVRTVELKLVFNRKPVERGPEKPSAATAHEILE